MEPLRLRAFSAVVAGLVAVAVVAVAGMILGESALDADPSAAEIAGLVVPVALLAALAGFVAGWLWRLWWPGSRTVAELSRAASELEEARTRIADLEARAPEPAETAGAPSGDEADDGGADDGAPDDEEAADTSTQPAPVAGSEAPTSPAAEAEPEAETVPALSMDDVPTVDIDQEAAVAQVTERFAGADASRHDDLKLIKGVGPVIERLLNDMNVRTFEQVASFTGEDVAVVSAALDGFPDRIVRDDWVGQARTLAERIKRA